MPTRKICQTDRYFSYIFRSSRPNTIQDFQPERDVFGISRQNSMSCINYYVGQVNPFVCALENAGLLCIYTKEPTKYPKETNKYQVVCVRFLLVLKTGLTSFSHKFLLAMTFLLYNRL